MGGRHMGRQATRAGRTKWNRAPLRLPASADKRQRATLMGSEYDNYRQQDELEVGGELRRIHTPPDAQA